MTESVHVVCPGCSTTNRIPVDRLTERPGCGRCKRPLFGGKPPNLTAAAFEKHLRNDDIPLVVDFWAPWCGPCTMMAPAFEQAAAQLEPKVRLVKVNTDAEPGLGSRFRISSIPTLVMFFGGLEVTRQTGAMDLEALIRWIEQQI
jgi:thioredoxin 2